jgi:archaemetzincin
LDATQEEIRHIFGYGTDILPLLEDLDFAYDRERDQYHSSAILERLDDLAPPRVIKVLAIAEVDLFIPILTYVYGEAQLGGRACIISTFRLKEALHPMAARETFLTRVIKESFHELGHTFRLKHCPDNSCIMHYARGIRDVDQKSEQFCRYCSVMIEDEKKRLAKLSSAR